MHKVIIPALLLIGLICVSTAIIMGVYFRFGFLWALFLGGMLSLFLGLGLLDMTKEEV